MGGCAPFFIRCRGSSLAGQFCSLRDPWRGWVAAPPSSSAVGVPRSRVSFARYETPGADGWLRPLLHPLSGSLARGSVLLATRPLARMGGCAFFIRCRGPSLAGQFCSLRDPWRGWVAAPPSSSAVGVPRSRVSSARYETPGADGWLRPLLHPLSGFLARGSVLLATRPQARMGGCAPYFIRCRGPSLAGQFCSLRDPRRGWLAPPSSSAVGVPHSLRPAPSKNPAKCREPISAAARLNGSGGDEHHLQPESLKQNSRSGVS